MKISFTLFSFLLYFFLLPSDLRALAFTGKLVKVLDGDTVEVLHNGKADRIRLHGIDAPEKSQPHGNKAKQFVLDIAAQKVVTVEVKDTDRYGRTVGEVILPDGRSLNREIVKEGYAWWYRKYSDDASLGALEAEARTTSKGLWADENPMPPWEWRAAARNQQKAQPIQNSVQANHSGTVYHGNIKSEVFHKSTCKDYNCKNCTDILTSREEAIKKGYRPCGMCKP